jgi:alanyl-tRNA synthetase
MTRRLYYDDAYTTAFTARVTGRLTVDDRPAVVLDCTYFYPAGGGQPADGGTIAGVGVVDVLPRNEDGAVLHLLAADVPGDRVECHVDWERRFDHMQHHTGQHILTRAFIQAAGADTIGFHLGEESVTIDLDKPHISPEMLDEVEDLANRIVFEDRPVTTRVIDLEEAESIRIRKMPDMLATDGLRVVEIADFDLTACGGTHVARTGEIGLIKMLRLEKRGDETRVEFRCGWRALRDLRVKNALVDRLAAEFTVGYRELDRAVERLRADLKAARSALKAAGNRLLDYEAADLLQSTAVREDVRLVSRVFEDRDVGEVRALAGRLVAAPGLVALLGVAGEKAQLILARSRDLSYDMSAALERALSVLGSARGGGKPDFAQGGGVAADAALVEAALSEAEDAVFRAG